MTSDVVLTAALRNNLLSLQSTQNQIDITQFRLATGRKINSALDGPQAFFAAQALNNRASDLTRLLDAMGQSIQVIKAADNGITALTKLVEQADSIANGARDALAQGQSEAKAVGDEDLRGITDIAAIQGLTPAGGDQLIFSITDEDGNAVALGPYSVAAASATATSTIAIGADMSIDELIAAINDLHLDNGGGVASGDQAFEASLNEKGQLQIRTLNGGDFNLRFESAAAGVDDAADLTLAAALGFANVARTVNSGVPADPNNTAFSSIADVKLDSFALYSNTSVPPQIAQASALLSTITDDAGNPYFTGIDNAADVYTISINGGPVQNIPLFAAGAAISIQSFVDQINSNTALNEHIEASYDDETGILSLDPIGGEVVSIEIGFDGNGAGNEANFGFGLTDLATTNAGEPVSETIRLAAAAADLAQFESDFNRLRDQIDLLVQDTGYRGTNLLNGDNLFTVFNEFRTSTLTTQGVTFTAEGLGLSEANFSRISSTDAALTEVRDALELVRNFGLTLASDLGVIQARENFTKDIINTLKEGSDKLTVADQNEEGAKLLALQTRQQLGVTSLSLASQSQQSILRLF